MTTQHTPGRLRVPDDGSIGSIQTESGMAIGQTFQTRPIRGAEDNEERKANARRLVACWNACDGVPTELLEKAPLDTVLKETVVQRDELLEALKDLAEAGEEAWGSDRPCVHFALKAIQKADGKYD